MLRGLLVLLLLAGPSGLLQTVAWLSMLTSRLPAQGFTGAITSTFSGEEPCALCCAATTMRAQEDDLQAAILRKQTEVLPPTALRIAMISVPIASLLQSWSAAVSWIHEVEPPRPRAVSRSAFVAVS